MNIFALNLPLLRVNKHNKAPAETHGVNDAKKGRKELEFVNHNIGVACGDGLIVIDVDPRNGGFETLAALESLHGRLPATWTVDTANRGRHFYFKGEMKSISFNGVDIQGKGKYVVAPPSAYPYGDYMWLSDQAPWECELAELPAWVKNLSKQNTRIGQQIGEGEVWNGNWERVEKELIYLTPKLAYKHWVEIGMALHWTGHEKAYETFIKWSRGDLYIRGEKYENFDEEACHRAWKSFKQGGGVTIGTLFEACRDEYSVWKDEFDPDYLYDTWVPPEDDHENEQEKDDFLKNNINLPEIKSPLISQLILGIKESAYLPNDEFAYGAAFAIMSAITQRGFVLDFFEGKTSTYSIILGPPACGKESYLNSVISTITDVHDFLLGDEIRSDQAMKEVLEEYPSRIVCLDEFPDRLAQAFNPKRSGDNNEYKVAMLYKELWSVKEIMPGSRVKTSNKAKSIKKVIRPCLSLFGAGTYDKISECMDSPEFIDGGLLSRLDMWVIKERIDVENDKIKKLDYSLKKKLKALFEVGCGGSSVVSTGSDSGKMVPDRKVIMKLSKCGLEAFKKFKSQCLISMGKANPKIRSLYDRASEKALRYGTMIAIGRGSFDVEASDVETGAEIAKHLVVNAKNLINVVSDSSESKAFKKACEDLYKFCSKRGVKSFTRYGFTNSSHTFKKKFSTKQKNDFFNELKDLELISMESKARGEITSFEKLDKFLKGF